MNYKFAELENIISEQQKGKEGTDVFAVGEQLKDICRHSPKNTKLLINDLSNNSQMTLEKAADKIKALADMKRKGDFSFVSPKEAEDVLRKFYGLHEDTDSAAGSASAPVLNLEDFL